MRMRLERRPRSLTQQLEMDLNWRLLDVGALGGVLFLGECLASFRNLCERRAVYREIARTTAALYVQTCDVCIYTS